MAQTIQIRRGTAALWTSVNPILSSGEIGFETNTGKFKIGDGSTAWALLVYAVDASLLTGTVSASHGGTGLASYTIGDMLYASGATALSKLSDVSTGNALLSGGVGVAPAWGKVALTTHISGILPVANGGTASATGWTAALDPGHKHSKLWASDGSSASAITDALDNILTGGVTAAGTNAEKVIGMGAGASPTTFPADMAQIWVADRNGAAGAASVHIANEDDTAGYPLGPLYGEMYAYENAVAVAIDETNVYHAISTTNTAGLCKGFTFKAGSTGPIASFATAEAGAATLITDVGHGLLDGEIITIANSTNYNGAHVVTKIDNDTFTIPVAYVVEAGGPNWIRGSSLQVDVGSAGVYRVIWGTTVTGAGANENMKVEPALNTTDLDNMATSRKLGGAGDRGAMGGSGLVTVADGDYLWFQTKNESSVADLTFRHFNASIVKL